MFTLDEESHYDSDEELDLLEPKQEHADQSLSDLSDLKPNKSNKLEPKHHLNIIEKSSFGERDSVDYEPGPIIEIPTMERVNKSTRSVDGGDNSARNREKVGKQFKLKVGEADILKDELVIELEKIRNENSRLVLDIERIRESYFKYIEDTSEALLQTALINNSIIDVEKHSGRTVVRHK